MLFRRYGHNIYLLINEKRRPTLCELPPRPLHSGVGDGLEVSGDAPLARGFADKGTGGILRVTRRSPRPELGVDVWERGSWRWWRLEIKSRSSPG